VYSSPESAQALPTLISHPLSQETRTREELERENGEGKRRKEGEVKTRQEDQPIIKLKSISISILSYG